MCSINILNAKLRTNYDKMKLVILLYNSVSLDRAMFLSEKKADIKENSIDGQLLNSCHLLTQEKQKRFFPLSEPVIAW